MTPIGSSPSTRVHRYQSCTPALLRAFQSGASIHAHTHCSKENLSFLPHYIAKIPYLRDTVAKVSASYLAKHGRPLDFAKAYWTPPLAPADVLASEARQINEQFGLQALVSLTDHDCFEASLALAPEVPIAAEWTVNFENTYLHLGVHNLDPAMAAELCPIFHQVTAGNSTVSVHDLLSLLKHSSGTLTVLNHPLWDVECSTVDAHNGMLLRFLKQYNEFIDAFEINGFRPWSENRDVLSLGETWGKPVVAGGDRHGKTPNTVVNLTSAATFAEFADEVRHDGISDVVLMPGYEQPLFTRQYGIAADALAVYPAHQPERQRWTGRVYFEDVPGQPRSIESLMPNGTPRWLDNVTSIAGALGEGPLHVTLRTVLRNEPVTLKGLPAGPHPGRAVRTQAGMAAAGSTQDLGSLLYSAVAKESE